jgi:hypothetical protein
MILLCTRNTTNEVLTGYPYFSSPLWRREIPQQQPWELRKVTNREAGAWGYNWATLSLEEINTETWSPGWGLDARLLTLLRRRTILAKSKKIKLNSMAWVRERTIPTERPPLVGEVSANSCGLRPYSRLSRPRPVKSREAKTGWQTHVRKVGSKMTVLPMAMSTSAFL